MKKASLQSARQRIQSFPKLILLCSGEATVYGKCVARKYEDIAPNACMKEFQMFKACLNDAAKKIQTKI